MRRIILRILRILRILHISATAFSNLLRCGEEFVAIFFHARASRNITAGAGLKTMLNRRGNKSKLLPSLMPLFPANVTTFIDMFCGSLAVSCAMLDSVRYVIANDADRDVSNLYHVWRDRPAELAAALEVVPYHSDILRRFREQPETDDLWRAVAFIYKSNFSFLSNGETLKFGPSNARQIALNAIRDGLAAINRIQFMSCDFRDVLPRISWRHERDKHSAFIYADPPYCGTDCATYGAATWTEQDTRDLFALLTESGLRFAISEFDGAFVRELARKNLLTVTTLGERRNIANRKTEILITNYAPQPQQASIFGIAGVQAGLSDVETARLYERAGNEKAA